MNSEKNVQFGNGTVTKRNRVKRESTREVHLAVTQRWKREPKSEICTHALGTDRPNG